jgi:amidophosphoribosyltransferase
MCGIVGIHNEKRQAGSDLFVGLTTEQHRGKESGGIVTSRFNEIYRHVGMGEIAQVFMGVSANTLPGRVGIGQVRYSNTGSSTLENAQPMTGTFRGSEFAVAHNGNLVNTSDLLKECALGGISLREDCSDTKIVAALIALSRAPTFQLALMEVLPKLQGAFSFVFLYQDVIYAARDAYGFHPLQIGRRGDDFIVSSESNVFDQLNIEVAGEEKYARFFKEVNPGEIAIISDRGLEVARWSEPQEFKFDIFEYIYFLRPDSKVHGVRVELARRRMGYYLALEHPADVDLVVPVSSSGRAAGMGYYTQLRRMGVQCEYEPEGLFRPNVVGRVYIEPFQELREQYLRIKFNVIPELVEGRRLVVVDDSIVRSNTMSRIVKLLRRAGAREIHVRVSCPPYRWPCIYGNDTYKDFINNRLIAQRLGSNIEAIAKHLGADSLGYLSLQHTKQAILDVKEEGSPLTEDSFYDAPFTGDYPAGTGDYKIS